MSAVFVVTSCRFFAVQMRHCAPLKNQREQRPEFVTGFLLREIGLFPSLLVCFS